MVKKKIYSYLIGFFLYNQLYHITTSKTGQECAASSSSDIIIDC
jgi:hypothetical protein